MMENTREKVLGYSVDLYNMQESIDFCLKSIKNNKNCHVVTINPEIIELANKNKEYETIIKNADLVIPDGVGIKIALKLKGLNIKQVPGIEFAYELLKRLSKENLKVALIGAKPEVIEKTVKNLKQSIENIEVSYYKDGYFSKEEEYNIINKIIESDPKVVLVALGAFKQDKFIQKIKEHTTSGVIFVGVGGSFDVWSGYTKRAPIIYQKLGLEWLYRIITQPQRIKRIFPTLPLFLIKAIIDSIQVRIEKLWKNS